VKTDSVVVLLSWVMLVHSEIVLSVLQIFAMYSNSQGLIMDMVK